MKAAATLLHYLGIERREDRGGDAFGNVQRISTSTEGQMQSLPSSRSDARPAAISSVGGPSKMDTIMTVPEVAAYLRVHSSTIYRLLREKKIPAFRVANDWRFNLSQVDAWRLALDGQQVK